MGNGRRHGTEDGRGRDERDQGDPDHGEIPVPAHSRAQPVHDRDGQQGQQAAADQEADDQLASVGAIREIPPGRGPEGNAGEGGTDHRGRRLQGQANVGGQQPDREYLQHQNRPGGDEHQRRGGRKRQGVGQRGQRLRRGALPLGVSPLRHLGNILKGPELRK